MLPTFLIVAILPPSPIMKVIDAHHHLWKYSPSEYAWMDGKPVLQSDQLIPQLSKIAVENGVNGFVTVQARQSIEETAWLLDLAKQTKLIRAVVGWVPLCDSEKLSECIDRFNADKMLKGVRHVVQDEPDDSFILGREFNRGIAALAGTGWTYDILIYGKHLTNTVAFVDIHPNQPFVLDHIAKPTIDGQNFDHQWAAGIRELAKRSNVTCKFSGVATEVRDASWSVQKIRPYWDVALEAFGAERLMYGSDWPVCLLRTSYSDWKAAVAQLASELSTSEQQAFWSGNPIRAYSMNA
ncbi:MAG: amidohydrolase family protein [Pirellulales bacterium]